MNENPAVKTTGIT